MQLCHITSPLPPDVKAIIYYITHYVVGKTKYFWAFYKLAVSYTPRPTLQKKPWNVKHIGTRFRLNLKGENTYEDSNRHQ